MNRQLLDHMDSWTAKFRNVSPVPEVCVAFRNKQREVEKCLHLPCVPKVAGGIPPSVWGLGWACARG